MKKYLLVPALLIFIFFTIAEARGAIFAEEMTSSSCHACPAVGRTLYQIYSSHEYSFYYVAMVTDKVKEAEERADYYNTYGYPTTFFDGGYEIIFGKQDTTKFKEAIEKSMERERKKIFLGVQVKWLGNNSIEISADIKNNENGKYEGNLKIYVVEKTSKWKDYEGNPYHFAFLGYGMDENLTLNPGEEKRKKVTWNGTEHGYEISRDNIMVIGVVFNKEGKTRYSDPPNNKHPFTAHFVDACTAATPPEDSPPSIEFIKTPENVTGYRNVSFEWDGKDDYGVVEFSYMLQGYDKEWHEWGDEKSVTYNDLGDGNYEFMVRARDNMGQITQIKWSFEVDTSSPKVVYHYPRNNQRNVPVDVIIKIKFSHDMDKKSVENGISISPQILYTVQWKSGREIWIFPQTMDYEELYTVTIKNARRVSGQIMKEYSFSFETSLPDKTPPSIIYVKPYYDELLDDIEIKFSEPMDTLIHNGIIIEPWLPYTYSWGENDTLLKIKPAEYKKGNYTIKITSFMTDKYGNPLDKNESFEVYITPPEIVYTSMEEGEKNVGMDSTLEIKFSHPMIKEEVDGNFSIIPACDYDLYWNKTILVVKMKLKENTTYHVYLPMGMKDFRGMEMEKPFYLNFSTVKEIERNLNGKQTPSFTLLLATISLAIGIVLVRLKKNFLH